MADESSSTALFFFNDAATNEITSLSLHDALPTSPRERRGRRAGGARARRGHALARNRRRAGVAVSTATTRSEEHTSELQSQSNIVCRLLLETKKVSPSAARPLQCASHESAVHPCP